VSLMKETNTMPSLSAEELDLKALLDRVLSASTVQPLRDDLARALPEIQAGLERSIGAAQKRLLLQTVSVKDQLREVFESELDAVKHSFREQLAQLSIETGGKLTQEARKTRVLLEMSGESSAAMLGSASERMKLLFDTIERKFDDQFIQLAADAHGRLTEEAKEYRASLGLSEENIFVNLWTNSQRMEKSLSLQLQSSHAEVVKALAAVDQKMHAQTEQLVVSVDRRVNDILSVGIKFMRRSLTLQLIGIVLAALNLSLLVYMAYGK
jgi:hypothetical protein